jgi:hypothetical protein
MSCKTPLSQPQESHQPIVLVSRESDMGGEITKRVPRNLRNSFVIHIVRPPASDQYTANKTLANRRSRLFSRIHLHPDRRKNIFRARRAKSTQAD